MKDVADFKLDIRIIHDLDEKEVDLSVEKYCQRTSYKRKISIDSSKIV